MRAPGFDPEALGAIWGEFGEKAPTTRPWGCWDGWVGGGQLLTHLHGRRLLRAKLSERERRQKSGEPPGRACGSAAPGAQSLGAPKFEPRVKH